MSEIKCDPFEERRMVRQSMESAQRRLYELEDKRHAKKPLTLVEIYEMDGLKDLIKCAKDYFKRNP